MLRLIIYLLRRPWAAQSPHLRAKFGEVLFEVFLPSSAKADSASQGLAGDGPHTYLLYSEPTAQAFMVPCLLLLYGDVERTGFYEKLGHRFRIASVLKHLWQSAEHKQAFRQIANEREYFVRFANGLMNETNNLVSAMMDKLPQIKQTQMLMKNPAEWARLTEEQRNQESERFSDNERSVKDSCLLCNETVHMLNYLTEVR